VPPGTDAFGAWSIDVLTVRDDRIAAITSFIGTEHFTAFDLPEVYPSEQAHPVDNRPPRRGGDAA